MIFENIKAKCKEKGISIAQLEKRAKLANATTRNWNKSSPRLESLMAVADVFGCSIDDLVRPQELSKRNQQFGLMLQWFMEHISDNKELFSILHGEIGMTKEDLHDNCIESLDKYFTEGNAQTTSVPDNYGYLDEMTVRWCREDLNGVLADAGYTGTNEQINLLQGVCANHWFRDAMIESGFAYIHDTVGSHSEELKALEPSTLGEEGKA